MNASSHPVLYAATAHWELSALFWVSFLCVALAGVVWVMRTKRKRDALATEAREHDLRAQLESTRRERDDLQMIRDGTYDWNERQFTEKLIETAQVIILLLDTEGRIVRYNPYMEKLSGHPLAEMKGEDWFEHFLPDSNREHIKTVFKKSVQNIHTCGHINEIIVQNNRTLQIEWYDDTLCDASGKVIGVLAIGIDVSERLEIQKHLQQSEERYALAVRGTNEGIWDWDLRANSLYLSQRWKAMLGYEDDELENSYEVFEKLIHPDDRPRVLDYVARYFNNEIDVYNIEFRSRHKDGSYRWIMARGEALRDEEGKPYRMAGSHSDITLRKQSEWLLKSQSRFLQTLMESVPIPIFYKDEEGRYIGCNRAFEELMEVTRDYIKGKTVQEAWPDGQQVAVYHQKDSELIEQGGTQRYTFKVTSASGKEHDVIFYKSVLQDEHGAPQGLIGAMLDITENNRMLREIETAKLELEETNSALEDAVRHAKAMATKADHANRAKSEFLANMSHEIRTPLNAIIGFSELLAYGIEDVKHREQAQIVANAGRSLLRLINDILDLSKVEAGKIIIELSTFEPAELIREIASIFQTAAAKKDLKLSVEIAEDMPLYAETDDARLRQILLNLVGNAVKYTEHGEVTVSARSVFQGELHGNRRFDLIIEVADTGIGVPEYFKEHIFSPFEQPLEQNHAKYGGSGLGLAISKRLAHLLSGEITLADRTDGPGSVFTLRLQGMKELASAPEKTRNLPDVSLVFEGNPLVLIVDDVQSNRKLLAAYLAPYSFRLIEADDGLDALELLEHSNVDMVLTDIKMPNMDGRELFAAMRSHTDAAIRSIPVIAITASGMMEQNVEDQNYFDGFLIKPVHRLELQYEMARFLPHHTPAAERQMLSDDAAEEAPRPAPASAESIDFEKVCPHIGAELIERFNKLRKTRQLTKANQLGKELEQIGIQLNEPFIKEQGMDLQAAAATFNVELFKQALDLLGPVFGRCQALQEKREQQ